ncbi:helix-turn-helix transcriptional regulator [Chryseobacterium aquaticum]|uniref:helix-turn-helix transcriptional regulator n=1 Tax=Chryseobacterium aquaticum TaxID=452084 RepID=UPI003F7001B2
MKKEKLIIIRKEKQISQADIATYLKISQTQYQKRESGKIKITDKEWQKISDLLNIAVDEIYEEHIESTTIDLQEELQILKEKIIYLEEKLSHLFL